MDVQEAVYYIETQFIFPEIGDFLFAFMMFLNFTALTLM